MNQEAENIKAQIEQTKTDLNENLLFLEDRIKDRVQAAKTKVEETLEEVKSEAIKFTPTYQVHHHPLLTVGAVTAAGLLVGRWLSPRERSDWSGDGEQAVPSVVTAAAARFHTPSRFSHELDVLKGLAIGSALRFVGKKAHEAFPQFGNDIDEIVEGIASKVRQA